MKLLVACILFLLASGCVPDPKVTQPDSATSTDYLIFGHFYGECGGEQCIETYKLTDTALFEDSVDRYPEGWAPYPGKFVKLSDSLFQEVRSLRENIPNELLSVGDTVFGMPDASDGGGLYIEQSINGKVNIWLIDLQRTHREEYLNPFVIRVQAAISKLSR
jgi:hypothetical protein